MIYLSRIDIIGCIYDLSLLYWLTRFLIAILQLPQKVEAPTRPAASQRVVIHADDVPDNSTQGPAPIKPRAVDAPAVSATTDTATQRSKAASSARSGMLMLRVRLRALEIIPTAHCCTRVLVKAEKLVVQDYLLAVGGQRNAPLPAVCVERSLEEARASLMGYSQYVAQRL